jgi:hypothetical protein
MNEIKAIQENLRDDDENDNCLLQEYVESLLDLVRKPASHIGTTLLISVFAPFENSDCGDENYEGNYNKY